MIEQKREEKKRGLTFIGLLYIIYYSILSYNYNTPVLYGGFIIVVGAIIVDKLLSSDRMKIMLPPACAVLFYFAAYCYFTRIWAWNPSLAADSSSFLIPVVVLVFIAVNYFLKIGNTKACIFAIIMSGLVLGTYVIIGNGGFAGFMAAVAEEGSRVSANERMNPNHIGMTCVISAMSLLFYGYFNKKMLCYIIAAFPMVIAFATGSRKVIVALAVGIFTMVLLSQKNKKGVIKYLKLVAILVVLVLVFQMLLTLDVMSTVKERMDQLFATITGDSYSADESSITRAKMIKVGLEQFKETPFLGIGMENSRLLNWRRLGMYTYSHSDYIEHMVNGGIVSILLYYGLIIYLAIKHIKLMKLTKKPDLMFSFVIMMVYLVINVAAVNYYGTMDTYLYFTLWISEVAICERELREKALQENNEEINTDGAV